MRTLHIAALFVAAAFTACQSNSSDSKASTADTIPTSSLDKSQLIKPGQAVGNIFLGQDMQAVTKILGKPDAGDAAMGKAWGIWYDKDSSAYDKSEVSIYSAYKDSTMMARDVKQIRTTANKFKTAEGIGVGSSLSIFTSAYPDAELVSQYVNATSRDTIRLYDSKLKGLAAETSADTISAISVHTTDSYANETYFTFNPNLKKIQH